MEYHVECRFDLKKKKKKSIKTWSYFEIDSIGSGQKIDVATFGWMHKIESKSK